MELDDKDFALINQDVSYDNNDGQNGTHWVGIKRDKNKLIYFDSFLMPPLNEVRKYAKDNSLELYFLDDNNNPHNTIQADESTLCGYYTVIFFNKVNNLKDLKKFSKIYTRNKPFENEKKVIEELNLI